MQGNAANTRHNIVSMLPLVRTTRKVWTRCGLLAGVVLVIFGLAGCGTPTIRSPDGTRTVSLKGIWHKVSVVENGQVLSKHDQVLNVMFSPDSKHLAYAVKAINILGSNKSQVIVDGRSHHGYQEVAGSSLAFSPDSQHVGYVASEDGRWFIVADGAAQSTLFFSGNSMPGAFRWFGRAFSHPPGGPSVLVCDYPMFLDGHDSAAGTSRRRLSSFADELKLDPGLHTIRVHYSGIIEGSSASSETVELQWHAKAGHVYLVSSVFDREGRESILTSALKPENMVNAILGGPFSRIGGTMRFVILDMTALLSQSIKYPPVQP